MKIYKVAQEVEHITPEEVEYIVQSFGTRRFTVGYRKGNGEFREINAQRHVRRPYEGGDVGGYVPAGLIVVYDLQIASQIAQRAIAEMDVNDYDPAILKKAYRRLYPENVEFIKGDGKTYVVYGTEWEDEFEDV